MDISINNVIEGFVAVFSALLVAGITWVIKNEYIKHKQELRAIMSIERNLVTNLNRFSVSISLTKRWSEIVDENRVYKLGSFSRLIIDNESHLNISDLNTINKIIKLNIALEHLDSDLSNLLSDYNKFILPFEQGPPKKDSEEEVVFQERNKSISVILKEIIKKSVGINNQFLEVICYVRLSGKIKKHSIFGYIDWFNPNVIPRMSKGWIKKEETKLKKEIEEKERAQQVSKENNE